MQELMLEPRFSPFFAQSGVILDDLIGGEPCSPLNLLFLAVIFLALLVNRFVSLKLFKVKMNHYLFPVAKKWFLMGELPVNGLSLY